MSTSTPLRAHAARNRERIVQEARRLFGQSTNTVTVDLISRAAGVGVGTLYRHFPTKEALAEAVYSAELDELEIEATRLLESSKSFDAMREWLDAYAKFVSTKHAMHDALRISLSSKSGHLSETRVRMTDTIERFLAAGHEDGSIRLGVRADDVTLGIAGAVYAGTTSPDKTQVCRIIDLLMAGLKAAGR